MKKILFFVMFILIGCKSDETADLIFANARIYTLNPGQPEAEAVAVKNGKIQAVGEYRNINKYKGQNTKVIDLNGKTITPGLIEGHGHFMGMGYSLMNLDLLNTKSYQEIIDMVEAAVNESRPGEWITGRGWHQSKWDSLPEPMIHGFPSHELLSEISPDNPVFLGHASGHAALVNKKAMEIAGVDSNTPEVEGGEIIRDIAGDPTGIFNETAMGLIRKHIPENTPASDARAYSLATENCLREGITGFHDAGAGPETISLYRDMIKDGKASIRLYLMLDGSNEKLLKEYYASGPVIDTTEHLLTIRAIKLYADGALGSRGAWLLEEYSDRPGHTGHSTSPVSYIRKVSAEALKHGFQVGTHAIGDRANREVLDIYEAVFEEHPQVKDPRFRIEHAQHLHNKDIARFAELGVLPAMQAIHLSSDRPWAIERLGPERIEEGAYVWQKLLDSGARIINGTDVPVEPLSPVACFYASVTRKTLSGEPPGGFEPVQRMTREQALRSYTLDAAYGAFEENSKGSIEPGKLADLTIFTKDIMQIPEDEILSAEIYMTVIGGEILYRKND